MNRFPRASRCVSLLTLCATLSIALIAGLACDDPASNPNKTNINSKTGGAPAAKTIGVIPKGTSHLFWRSVEAGARKAGAELGVTIDWQGPSTEEDVETQKRIVGDMLVKGVNAIVIAPLDKTAITRDLDAASKKVPVVVYDSGSSFADYKAYVATDNYQGGKLAAERMLKILPTDKDIYLALIRYGAASESTLQREAGFLDTIKAAKHPRIKYDQIVDQQFAGGTADKATTLTSNILQANANINAIFASNESTARGALSALEKAGQLGKVTFIGFDSSPQLIDALAKGHIQGLVLQDPVRMGYLSVKAAVAAVRGETVTREQPITPVLVTPENRTEPAMAELLSPKLE